MIKLRKNRLSGERKLSFLLSIWVYIYALFYFIPLIIPSNSILMYISLMIMDILILYINRKFSVNMYIFLLIYCIAACINCVFVSYTYYVIIEAFSGLAVFLPAILIINTNQFNLKDFSKMWIRFAVISTLITPVAIVLVQAQIIDYGVFTYLCLPNAIIFSYATLITRKEKKYMFKYYGLALLNFFVILAFGGRMAAFTGLFTLFISYMISKDVSFLKKAAIIVFGIFLVVMIISNLTNILIIVQDVLDKYNMSSRTLTLLTDQLRSGNMGIYMTRRDVLYEIIIDYIIDRAGLPGGFGVTLAITDGAFYHPHNLILQLAVMIGGGGAAVFLMLVVYKILRFKRNNDDLNYRFVLLLVLDYSVISLTGGSILINYIAIIGMAVLFFYRGDWYKQNSRV